MSLYHVKPREMRGTQLKSLATLKSEAPDLYREYHKKYRGRNQILQKPVPNLNCQWMDVVFLSPIHPQDIRRAYDEVGMKFWERLECFEIDPAALDVQCATMWMQRPENLRGVFWQFAPAELEQYRNVPAETLEYLKEAKAARLRKPFRYLYTPHVLYRGTIDTRGLPIVNSD